MYIQSNADRWLSADAITSVRATARACTVTLDESAPFLRGDKKTYTSVFQVTDPQLVGRIQEWIKAQQKAGKVVALTTEVFVVRSKVLVVTKNEAKKQLILRCRGGGALALKGTGPKHVVFARPLAELVATLTAD